MLMLMLGSCGLGAALDFGFGLRVHSRGFVVALLRVREWGFCVVFKSSTSNGFHNTLNPASTRLPGEKCQPSEIIMRCVWTGPLARELSHALPAILPTQSELCIIRPRSARLLLVS